MFSFLIEILTSPLRTQAYLKYGIPVSFQLCSVVTFALFFIYINLILIKNTSKLKPQYILLACIIGCSILQLPFRMIHFNQTLISLPDFLFHLLGIFMGYFFHISGKYVKTGIAVTSLLCCLFFYFKGYPMLIHKQDFGTFTGLQNAKAELPEFQFIDRSGNTIANQDFVGKYTILDFWQTSCGICFQEFPKFDEYYMKYNSNNRISLYAVNVKLSRDKEDVAFEAISKLEYSFPTLLLEQMEDAKNIFGVLVYPTVVVFNPQGIMVFRGDIDKAFSYVEGELKK